MNMKSKFLILSLFFFVLSCGSESPSPYTINIEKSSDFLKNGDKINLSINSTKKIIENVVFTINDVEVDSNYTIKTKLGENEIKASFNIDDKSYLLKKEIKS